jgi:hypothetical protein
MPKYSASPFNAIQMAIPGRPAYVWGGFNDAVSPTTMRVTNVAITTNVATLNVTVTEGNIPVVGSFITVRGTQQSAGVFNVTSVALASVTINATTGIGTVTFALTNANVGSVADAGIAIVPQPITFESVSTNDVTQPVSLLDPAEGKSIGGFSAEVIWATSTSAGVVTVLAADKNDSSASAPFSAYQSVGTITFPATRLDVATSTANFVALSLTGALTGSSTIAGRILSR